MSTDITRGREVERGGRRGRGRKQEAVEPVKQFPFPAPPHTAQQHSTHLEKWRTEDLESGL